MLKAVLSFCLILIFKSNKHKARLNRKICKVDKTIDSLKNDIQNLESTNKKLSLDIESIEENIHKKELETENLIEGVSIKYDKLIGNISPLIANVSLNDDSFIPLKNLLEQITKRSLDVMSFVTLKITNIMLDSQKMFINALQEITLMAQKLKISYLLKTISNRITKTKMIFLR